LEQQFVYDKRFIEETFPVKQVSVESSKEKNIRQGNISTLHIWWARRPISSSRATNYASLIASPNSQEERESTRKFIATLAKWESATNRDIIERAIRDILKSNHGKAPKVLDPFAGGGAIPLEALRLGCETYASDYNPVATLLLKCTLEFAQRYSGNLNDSVGGLSTRSANGQIEDLRTWGRWVFEEAQNEIGKFYPAAKDG
jgi:putative DNA methylase